MPEVRRLLVAVTESPERFRFRLDWSVFRRRHQAVAQACHSRRRARQQTPALGSPTTHTMAVSDLERTDERWDRIAQLLPPEKPERGRPNKEHRAILTGMLWVVQTGAAWRDVPDEFGPWQTIHTRYQRWRKAGIWQQILDALTQQDTGHDS